jgi:fucose permease
MRERDGGAVSSYSSAAFFGGPTCSRIFLLPLTTWMTEKRAVTIYVVSALAMQAVVWISSSFLADFIAFGAYGFVMGPMYPITPSHQKLRPVNTTLAQLVSCHVWDKRGVLFSHLSWIARGNI